MALGEIVSDLGLLGLFIITALSASIFPFPSEPQILAAAIFLNPGMVFIVAVAGGVLGSAINYFIGLKGVHGFLVKRDAKAEKKAQKVFGRWGPLVLLVAPWIPFIGDPMTIVAGALRMELKKFFLLVILSRIIKTAVLVFLARSLI
ncbi:MAG TPA: VTT domain-containing protein [archaeon]|nr:VTT domain-containing protein [archaeon]